MKLFPCLLGTLSLFSALPSILQIYFMRWNDRYSSHWSKKSCNCLPVSKRALLLLFCSSSQSLCTPTSFLFVDSYCMSTDDCNDSFCKDTTEILYLAIWWSVRLGSSQENQRKCKQWQKAYKSSHWHQLCGIVSTSSSGPPIDLWKTILHKLNLNRFLDTIFLKTTFMLQTWFKEGLPHFLAFLSGYHSGRK